MKSSIWKKYESDGEDGFPIGVKVYICEKLGDEVEFDKKYSEFYFINEEPPSAVVGCTEKNLKKLAGLKKSC